MKSAPERQPYNCQQLQRLNQLSLSRSFTPQVDIDWNATTTDAEYESLYSSWSLLEGTGVDRALDADQRAMFVKYQQMNLMIFTALLERYGIHGLAKLYDLESSPAFSEYVGHFIKEEIYHYTMFMRTVDKIKSTMPGCRALPTRGLHLVLRWMFRLLNVLPGTKLRCSVSFTFFRFAEQISIFAHQVVQSKIPRRESLIKQVWGYHALDESRHLAFDAMILERNKLRWPLAGFPLLLAAPCCVLLSAFLNANEVWIGQQLGLSVRLWQLPRLVKRTKAPFKRRVFGLLTRTVAGAGPAQE